MIIPNLILQKNIKSPKKHLEVEETSHSIEYIFNPYTQSFTIKNKIYLVSMSLIKLLSDILYILYHYFLTTEVNYIYILNYSFNFEIIMLFLLIKILSKNQYYRHHYLSIIFLTLSSISYFIYEYTDNSIGIFFLHLLCDILYSFFRALILIYIKGLMKYKYITPYKACYSFGLINFVIITIILIISSFIPCNSELCKVEYNNKNYFGNIIPIFTIEGLILFLITIMKTSLLLMNYIIVNKFTVFHSYFAFQFTYLTCILLLGITQIDAQIIIALLIYFVISTFFLLIFIEIIEINICNISYYTKKNIIEREIQETKLIDESNVNNNDIEEVELSDIESNTIN